MTPTTVYNPESWGAIGIKLWDAAARYNSIAAGLLGLWRMLFEALKAHVGSKTAEKEHVAPTDPPPLQTL